MPALAGSGSGIGPGQRGRAGRVAPQRAGKLQPVFRRQRRRRCHGTADPGPAGPSEPRDRRHRARPGRELGGLPGRSHADLEAEKGRHFFGRRAVHVGRRAVLVRRRLRCSRQPARRQRHGRWPAAGGHGTRSCNSGAPVSNHVCSGRAHPRQPANPAPAQARGRRSRTGRSRRPGPLRRR